MKLPNGYIVTASLQLLEFIVQQLSNRFKCILYNKKVLNEKRSETIRKSSKLQKRVKCSKL